MLASDISAQSNQVSFESWTEWSKFYVTALEIFEYWTKIAAEMRRGMMEQGDFQMAYQDQETSDGRSREFLWNGAMLS